LNGEIKTGNSVPIPMRQEIESRCGSLLTHITIASESGEHVLTAGDKQLMRKGRFMEAAAPDMLSLRMQQGTAQALGDHGGEFTAKRRTEEEAESTSPPAPLPSPAQSPAGRGEKSKTPYRSRNANPSSRRSRPSSASAFSISAR
jgi:hypothetical protein